MDAFRSMRAVVPARKQQEAAALAIEDARAEVMRGEEAARSTPLRQPYPDADLADKRRSQCAQRPQQRTRARARARPAQPAAVGTDGSKARAPQKTPAQAPEEPGPAGLFRITCGIETRPLALRGVRHRVRALHIRVSWTRSDSE
jgi:hypothetical protein